MKGNISTSKRQALSSKPLVRFLGFVKPHLRLAAGAASMATGKFTLALLFPLATKYIIDVLIQHETHLSSLNAFFDHWCTAIAAAFGFQPTMLAKLGALGGMMLVVFALQAMVTYCSEYWAGKAGNRMIHDLRCRMFSHLQTLSHSFFDRNPSGAIASRFITDVELAQNLVTTTMVNVWTDGAQLIGAVGILFLLDRRLAMLCALVIPIYVCLIRTFAPKIHSASREVQDLLGEFSGDLQEQVAGMCVIKSYGRQEYVANQFYGRTGRLHERTIERVRLTAGQQMFTEFITRVAPMVVVAAAALLIIHGGMELGTIFAFVGLMGYIYQPLEHFSQMSALVSTALAAIERIFDFLDCEPEVTDIPDAKPLEIRDGSVEFDNVSFGYAGRNGRVVAPILKNINLKVKGGMTVALVGRSGAGKTTLASLVGRFYDATTGRMLIDGQDVRDLKLSTIQDAVGVVRQETLLFSTTIRENLSFGKANATDEEMWEALENANIKEFVEGTSDGLDTIIGERGVKLSGGQRQRLALARAFLKNPPILILDEATSALDSESENLIRDAIRRLMSKRTSFMIAHRLAMAVNADLIVVLDKGEIVEAGTHDELIAANGIYANLFHEQTRGLVPQTAIAAKAADRPRIRIAANNRRPRRNENNVPVWIPIPQPNLTLINGGAARQA
jgi:ATP-binding cassette, subfamily B, putative efflux pump